MRFFSLQRMRVMLRCRGRPSLATIPLRPLSFMQHRRGSMSSRRFGPCGFSLRVKPCAARAAGTTIHTGWHGSFVAVSLFTRRSATRFCQPVTTGPDLLRFRSGSAPGILAPFAVFPACGFQRLFPPFIPTCCLPIVQHRCFLRLLAAVSELLPSESGFDTANCQTINPASGYSAAGKPNQTHRAMRLINPALGFIVFSQAFRCVRNQLDKPTAPKSCLLPPRQGRGIPSPRMHACT